MMGLLSSIKSAATKVLDTVVTTYSKPLAVAKAVVSPKTTVKEVVAEFRAQPIETQKKGVIKAAAGYSAALVGAAVAAVPAAAAVVVSAAKAVIPATAKGKVIAAVAAPVVVGAVVREPAKAIQTVIKAPSELAQFGGDVASFAVNPSLETAKQVITESPIISTGVGLLATGAAISKIAPAIASIKQTEAIQEQTKALEGLAVAPALTPESKTAIAPQTPITPATQPLIATAGNGTTTTRKRRYTKAKPQQISQRVNIIMQNKVTSTGTKNYLNKRLLAY